MSRKLSESEARAIEARIKALPDPDLTDPDNPEWTEADFVRAKSAGELPPEVLAAFPKTRARGRPKADNPYVPISLRLAPDVVRHLRATGAGWQTRVNEALAQAIKAGRL